MKEVKKIYLPLEVREIRAFANQPDGTEMAMLRQVVRKETTYSGLSVSNSLQGNIYNTSDFKDIKNNEPYISEEKRGAYIIVPKGTTKEKVISDLKKHPEACIYRILSDEAILTEGQKYKISVGDLSLEEIENKQEVINPETGEIVLNNGKRQFRQTFFSKVKK